MRAAALALLLLLGGRETLPAAPALRVSPPEWSFGTVPASSPPLEQAVTVENNAGRPVRVSLISTCSCLSVQPGALTLQPGEKGAFRLRLDPAGESGEVQKDLILRSDLEGLGKALYPVYGRVQAGGDTSRAAGASGGKEAADGAPPSARSAPGEAAAPPAAAGLIVLEYYHSPGCSDCLRFLEDTLPAAARRLGVEVRVEKRSVLDPEVYPRWRALLASLGEEERAYPALAIVRPADGSRLVLQGKKEIERLLEQSLREAAAAPGDGKPPAAAAAAAPGLVGQLTGRLAFLPVLAAGLLDGVNPCAFTTLIFLLAALSYAGRGRREILLIGGFFSLAVLVTYFLLGLGLFQALRLADGFPLAARLLRWVLIAALALLSAMSLYDFFQIRAGRANRILGQLPGPLKRRIHSSIRSRVGSLALVSSSLVLGALVSVFELACTGQVYFPTLAYLARTRRETAAFFYLILYNLGFIAPLLAVFALSWAGVASQRFTSFLQRSMGPVKLALAFLFAALAILTGLS